MTEKGKKLGKAQRASSRVIKDGPSDEELLMMYLSMPKKERGELFADTARAAELTDLSQRTIQFWIETGAIRAIPIGKKYQVYLESLGDYLKKEAKKRAS
jgi:excisionase family DNA binding protein